MTYLRSSSSSPFGLSLQSGVVTAYYHSPNHPVFNVRLLRTKLPHILLYHIQKSSPWSLHLLPSNSISNIFLPTYSWSLLMTCSYHLSLSSLIFIPNLIPNFLIIRICIIWQKFYTGCFSCRTPPHLSGVGAGIKKHRNVPPMAGFLSPFLMI